MDWNVEWNNGMDLYYHIATYKINVQIYMVEQQIALTKLS